MLDKVLNRRNYTMSKPIIHVLRKGLNIDWRTWRGKGCDVSSGICNLSVHFGVHVGFDVGKAGAGTVIHLSPLNGARCAAEVLLQDVGEFMRQQLATRVRCGRVFARSEHNMAADRIGSGSDLSGGFRSIRTGVYAHVPEIGAEAWLYKVSGCWIEGLAGSR